MHKRERELAARKADGTRLAAIMDAVVDCIISIDENGMIDQANKAVEDTFGYSPNEVVGRSIKTLMSPEHAAKHDRRFREYLESGTSRVIGVRHEMAGLHKNGHTFPIDLHMSEARIGGQRAFIGIVRDITERERAESTNRRLASGIESAGEAIIMTDRDGIIQYVNPAFTTLTGYTAEEAIGQSPGLLKSGRHPEDYYKQMWRTIQDGEVWTDELVNRHKNGTLYDASLTIAPVLDGNGDVEGFVGIQLDITERKRAESELRTAKDAADAAARAKSEFLANMSHEIRTPLTAILGHSELLERDGDMRRAPKSRIDALRAIRRNGDHLLEIISDILDLSKIEAGKMRIKRESCDPAAIVAEVADAVRPRLETGVSLRIASSDAPRLFLSSRMALRQIVLNLLGNAVKFTASGEIKVEIRQSGDEVIFDVSDTGEGMACSCTAGLFQPFYQLDSSHARKHEGAGLGLAISKRLANALGGDVTVVHTVLGEGSTFRLTLPNNRDEALGQEEQEQEQEQEQDLTGLRILLADDVEDNRAVTSELLRRAGAKVTTAVDGSEALEQISVRGFDIVVMDMHMPVMDGWEATRMLRDTGFDMPVIALTAISDSERCAEAGCSMHLLKPMNIAVLTSAIRKCLDAVPA